MVRKRVPRTSDSIMRPFLRSRRSRRSILVHTLSEKTPLECFPSNYPFSTSHINAIYFNRKFAHYLSTPTDQPVSFFNPCGKSRVSPTPAGYLESEINSPIHPREVIALLDNAFPIWHVYSLTILPLAFVVVQL